MTNVLFFGLILMAIFSWIGIGKEEMPEFESNWVRVTTYYPGAPSGTVELFVTKPLEDELKSVDGIEEVSSTSSVGVSTVRMTLDDDYPQKDEVLQEIKDSILRANLPSEVRDLPRIRQFKSASKAILDIGVYYKGKKYLDTESRALLQKHILRFESQLIAMKEIASVDKNYYRKPELQIIANPEGLLQQEVSLADIRSQIIQNNIRAPIGTMKDKEGSKITAIHELDNVTSLINLKLRGNYQGLGTRLGDIAHIQNGFFDNNAIFKINGHEAVFLNIKKNVSTDILSAQKAVMNFIKNFEKANKNSPIGFVLMDDESYAVRNRLDIVSTNGVIGFFLIVLVLFIFLDVKSGFWVAMGIPFCAAFTLIACHLIGYTVNNMTLAGLIIVLGIVVDDAIIIAENIARHRSQGLSALDAAIVGTSEVIKPIFASIVTTCVAFIPLIYFEGFFGKLVSYIPLVVTLMLAGSLLESIFILPSHLNAPSKLLDRFDSKSDEPHWFFKYEDIYRRLLLVLFKKRLWVFLSFGAILIGGGVLYKTKMNFVMFPREESAEVFVKVEADEGFTKIETAKAIAPLEEMFFKDEKNIVAVRSTIGITRWGGEVRDNKASMLVELIPADDRPDSLNVLMKKWESKSNEFPGIKKVKFLRGRWGHGSEGAIDIQIQENDDSARRELGNFLTKQLEDSKIFKDVELREPIVKKEYIFQLNQENLVKFDVTPSAVTSTLRSFVEGSILYSLNKGEEEVDVRLTVPIDSKKDLKELLKLRVSNNTGNLIYVRKVVDIVEVQNPVNISHADFKRASKIVGTPVEENILTPLQIAEKIEQEIFPKVFNAFPTAILKFRGEVENTRESQGEFSRSIIMVIGLIYLILVLMFNSITKPFLVLSIVPFGLAGVVFVLYAHGMSVYGFFAAIGALGMIGVVINDAIVMIDKIDKAPHRSLDTLARVASTRLRPVVVTTITTVIGILPTAYGLAGYDSMLAEMMLTMGWGLAFGTCITLFLIPCLYSLTVGDKLKLFQSPVHRVS